MRLNPEHITAIHEAISSVTSDVLASHVFGSRLTVAKAAKLASLNIYDSIAACKANQLPVINISREELLEDLEGMPCQ